MRIIDMVNAKFPNAANNEKPTQASDNGFDAFLADAGRRQAERTSVERTTNNRSDDHRARNQGNQERSRNIETRREPARPIRQNSQSEETDAATDSAAATATVTEQTAPTEVNYATEHSETAIIEEIAEIMQVPVEVVMEWIEELGITAQDLVDSQVVVKMLQHALGAEDPVELLTHPEFSENYKAVNEAVAEVMVKTATPVTNKATISENTVTVNAEGIENLEAVIKDGEVVISEKSDENFPGNSEQRDTTPTSTKSTQTDQVNTTTTEQQSAAPTVEVPTADAPAPESVTLQDSQPMMPIAAIETATTTATSATQTATPQAPVTASNVIEQIMNQVKLTSAGGQFTEMRMTLRPDNLGDIVLRVVTQNGIVMAQFEAESQRVKELLEANFNQLRDALQEQGITFSELSVSVRQDENERLNQFERARQATRHRAESVEDVSEEAQEISYHNGVIDVIA